MNLLDTLINWASDAWNWLNRFFKRFWGFIVGWWSKLKSFVKESLEEFKEVVILDRRQDGGEEFVKALREAQPNVLTLDDIENLNTGLVAVGINENNKVGKVESLQAETQQEDGFDISSQKHNGIVRISN